MNIHTLFPSKYVKAADLSGKPVTVTIQRLAIEKMGQEQEPKPVLYFERATKGMVLNKVNAMTIASLYGPETDNWRGKRITIYPTKVRAFGAVHDAIRVKEEIPAQPANGNGKAHPVEEPPVEEDAEDVLDENPFES